MARPIRLRSRWEVLGDTARTLGRAAESFERVGEARDRARLQKSKGMIEAGRAVGNLDQVFMGYEGIYGQKPKSFVDYSGKDLGMNVKDIREGLIESTKALAKKDPKNASKYFSYYQNENNRLNSMLGGKQNTFRLYQDEKEKALAAERKKDRDERAAERELDKAKLDAIKDIDKRLKTKEKAEKLSSKEERGETEGLEIWYRKVASPGIGSRVKSTIRRATMSEESEKEILDAMNSEFIQKTGGLSKKRFIIRNNWPVLVDEKELKEGERASPGNMRIEIE